MTTWNFKAPFALVALFALVGCEEGADGGLMAALSSDSTASADVIALSQTQMGNGAFTLVPPQGFCIDKASLKQRFALMARCDALGAPDRATGAPLGIITVSTTAQKNADRLPAAQETADAAKLAGVSSISSTSTAVTFRAAGKPVIDGLDTQHWRANLQVGGQTVGIALYGKKGGRAVSTEGREILNDLIRRTLKAS
jgi:hypothetical protein